MSNYLINQIPVIDYISNNEVAKQIITSFTKNSILLKASTGLGATQCVLEITDSNVIATTTNVGMIQTKEASPIRMEHQRFIYGSSEYGITDYITERLQGKTLALYITVESFMKIIMEHSLEYDMVTNTNIFSDEFDVMANATYRDSLIEYYDYLLYRHKGIVKLSTATPTVDFLDIPEEKLNEFAIYNFYRQEQPIQTIKICNFKEFKSFVVETLKLDRKLLVFSNDQKIHNMFLDNVYLNSKHRIQQLASDLFMAKEAKHQLNTIKKWTVDGVPDPNADIYLCTDRYAIGWDFPYDCSIAIICDQKKEHERKTVPIIKQIRGRGRAKVYDCGLFYTEYPYEDGETPKTRSLAVKKQMIEAQQIIQPMKYEPRHLERIRPLLLTINEGRTFPKAHLIESLKEEGLTVIPSDYISEEVVPNGLSYKEGIDNLRKQPIDVIKRILDIFYENIKGDDKDVQGVSPTTLSQYVIAFFALSTGSNYFDNIDISQCDRAVEAVYDFITVNELQSDYINTDGCYPRRKKTYTKGKMIKLLEKEVLHNHDEYISLSYHDMGRYFLKAKMVILSQYEIICVKNKKIDEETIRIMDTFKIIGETILNAYCAAIKKIYPTIDVYKLIDEKDRNELNNLDLSKLPPKRVIFNNLHRDLQTKLSTYQYTEKEKAQIGQKINSIQQSLMANKHGLYATIKSNMYDIPTQLKRHRFMVYNWLATNVSQYATARGFKVLEKDHRLFNTYTKTTRQLRRYTPYILIEADIKSAFASFVDLLVGSNLGSTVYDNVQKLYPKLNPKVKYNTVLNDWKMDDWKKRKFFKEIGYTPQQVNDLMLLSTNKKGDFYRQMVKLEEQYIDLFRYENYLNTNRSPRIHDGLFITYDGSDRNFKTDFGMVKFVIKSHTDEKQDDPKSPIILVESDDDAPTNWNF